MTTQTDIANRALQMLGIQKRISSLAQDSAEAQACALIINNVRDAVTRLAPWTSAMTSVNLALIYAAPGTPENSTPATNQWQPGQPIPPWAYEYAYPTDCLRALWLQSTYTGAGRGQVPISPVTNYSPLDYDRTLPFKIQVDPSVPSSTSGGSKVLLTNIEMPTLTYLAQITNPDQMDPMLQNAWATALAASLAPSLTDKPGLRTTFGREVNAVIDAARAADANEEFSVPDHTPDWIRAHGFAMPCQIGSAFNWGGLWL